MSLAAELGYTYRRPHLFHRLMQRFGGTRVGGWLFSRMLRHLDDLVGRLTKRRHSVPGLLAGIPVLDVTTTGRRSRLPRTSHLIAVPVGDTLALLGTNFAQPSTPAWVLNLEADPRATISYRGRTVEALARPATDAEFEEVFANSGSVYTGYEQYRRRISGRRLRVFVLEAA